MHNFLNLKFIAFGTAFIVIAFFAAAKFSIFDSLHNSSSVENVVEANAATTPMPTPEPLNDFRPDGGFELSPKSSKLFKEVIWLSVITGSGVGYGSSCAPSPCTPPPIEKRVNWIPQTPRGLLITKDYMYDWRNENLSADNFSFVTEIHKGQGYKFTGRFLTGGNFEESKPKDTVVTGYLIKLVNGKSVAEEYINFNWFSWDEVDQQNFRRIKPKYRK